jgi:hypothetical protein
MGISLWKKRLDAKERMRRKTEKKKSENAHRSPPLNE